MNWDCTIDAWSRSMVTEEQIDELKANADNINYEVAKEREKVVRHDVMSHVYAYGTAVSEGEQELFIWEQLHAM